MLTRGNLFFYLLFIAFVFFGDWPHLQAQVRIRSEISKNEMKIGEVLVYTIRWDYPEQIKWISEPVVNLEKVEILQIQNYPLEKKNQRIYHRLDYLVTTFQIDTFNISSPYLFFSNGKDTLKAEGQGVTIRVRSVLDSAAGELRPEKPIIEGQIRWTELVITVLVILTILILLWIYLWRRLRVFLEQRRKKIHPVPEIIRSPEEMALGSLEQLRRLQLPQKGEYKRYHTEIANIIRVYIEHEYHLPAMELPTSEIITSFHKLPQISGEWIQRLHEFLDICDRVKFAKHPSSPELCQIVDQQAEYLIREKFRIKTVTEEKSAEVL